MTRRKRLGRPPLAGETADQRIELRVTAAELAAIDKAAARVGLTRSEWIREACDVHAGEDSVSRRGEVVRACDEMTAIVERIRDAI